MNTNPTILEIPVEYTPGQRKGKKRKQKKELLILSYGLKVPPDIRKFIVEK